MTFNIGATTVINSGRCLTNIANASTAPIANGYVIRDANGAVCASNFFVSIADSTSLGTPAAGGFLICKESGIGWIVAPNTSEVSRTWYLRDDAVARAQVVSECCTGWFVPTRSQLQNPGYTCRTFWDSFSSSLYWSSTQHDGLCGCRVSFVTGASSRQFKTVSHCVRAFRCVTY
jgi:hypothetical protein